MAQLEIQQIPGKYQDIGKLSWQHIAALWAARRNAEYTLSAGLYMDPCGLAVVSNGNVLFATRELYEEQFSGKSLDLLPFVYEGRRVEVRGNYGEWQAVLPKKLDRGMSLQLPAHLMGGQRFCSGSCLVLFDATVTIGPLGFGGEAWAKIGGRNEAHDLFNERPKYRDVARFLNMEYISPLEGQKCDFLWDSRLTSPDGTIQEQQGPTAVYTACHEDDRPAGPHGLLQLPWFMLVMGMIWKGEKNADAT